METNNYKKPSSVSYHVFSDNIDDYVYGEDVEKVLEMVGEIIEDGGNVRVYKQTEWNEEDGIWEDGDCILSIGSFPI